MKDKHLSETQITLMTIYGVLAWVIGGIVFVGAWLYCIYEYGFLLGIGLGWFPSAIVGYLAGILWPLVVIGFVWLAYQLFGAGYF